MHCCSEGWGNHGGVETLGWVHEIPAKLIFPASWRWGVRGKPESWNARKGLATAKEKKKKKRKKKKKKIKRTPKQGVARSQRRTPSTRKDNSEKVYL